MFAGRGKKNIRSSILVLSSCRGGSWYYEGTAEHGSDGETPHSWFVGFSNADDPDIVIAVVAENGGYSSEVAVPIARQVIEAYYAQQ